MAGLAVPTDGRLTSQNLLTGSLTGNEVMYIVSPGTAVGNSYQVTTLTLASYFSAFAVNNTKIISTGATLASPYAVLTTDTRLLFQKGVPSASYAILPPAQTMQSQYGVYFKDILGDAGTHPITIAFSNGELCDGLSTMVINNPYGWLAINPIPGQNAWYQSQ